MTFLLAHVWQPSGLLPLRWFRLPLLLATLGLSCVCIAVGAQALDKSSKLERRLKMEAENTGSTIDFDMNDIRATTIVLTTVASLLALTSLVFSVALAFDWIRLLLRPRNRTAEKERNLTPEGDSPVRLPFSTRSLPFQTIVLSFLTVWIFSVLIPSTVFARTRSAHLTIQNEMLPLTFSVDTVYWNYGFLRCLAAAPWFTFIFSFPASIITWVAWKFHIHEK